VRALIIQIWSGEGKSSENIISAIATFGLCAIIIVLAVFFGALVSGFESA